MLSAIFGLKGTTLTPSERAFIRETDPWAFILFARNVQDRRQVRALLDSLRSTLGRDCLVFIDQEGGRVQRLRPPEWFDYPSGADYARAYAKDVHKGRRAAWLGHRLIAHDLREIGVTASCAPVLDIPRRNADPIISDRAFGEDPAQVIDIAHAAMAGLSAGGVATVIKHIPGHGRAEVDSHLALPVIAANDLSDDFEPFAALNDALMAMTAHAVYIQADARLPITLSARGIQDVIRDRIGFDGLLMTDDLDMKALTGRPDSLARRALRAGCDVVLQCSGDLKTMERVARGCHDLSGKSLERARMAEWSVTKPEPLDEASARAELSELVA